MSNKQETIADIVADIRAQNQGLPEDSYALSPLVCDLLSFADRIEAAHQREVGELCGERNGILNANARLIAAAPDLYEALQMYQEAFSEIRKSAWFLDANFHEIMSLNKVMTAADAALAKAAGESEVEK